MEWLFWFVSGEEKNKREKRGLRKRDQRRRKRGQRKEKCAACKEGRQALPSTRAVSGSQGEKIKGKCLQMLATRVEHGTMRK